jgi:cytochrome c
LSRLPDPDLISSAGRACLDMSCINLPTMKMPRLITFLLLSFGLCLASLAATAVELEPIAPRLANANPERGSKIFLQCQACHVSKEGAAHTIGPNLWSVVGRPVAASEGFDYTDSLKAVGGEWDFETLSRYLFDPSAMAPQTRMVFGGVKRAEDRADLIAYLQTFSNDPVALPSAPAIIDGPRYGGLPDGEGREATYFTCRACHSVDQFTDRTLSPDGWSDLIEEMVADHGMAAPEGWARRLMVDYLAMHFGEVQEENWEGLPPGPGREEVYYTCNACHSLKLVTQQGMSRDRWNDLLDWMIEEQGMNEFDTADARTLVLDYLEQNFGS